MYVHCSSLPRLFQCAPSAEPPEISITGWTPDASNLGDATHELGAGYVIGAEFSVTAVAAKYDVDADELGKLYSHLRVAWAGVRDFFPAPMTEHEMTEDNFGIRFALTGTADVVSISDNGKRGAILDWKSGFLEQDARHQLMGYAYLLFQQEPDLETVWIGQMQLRSMKWIKPRWVTREEAELWREQLADHLKDKTYRVGPECRYCPRADTCDARRVYLRSALATVTGNEVDALSKDDLLKRAGRFLVAAAEVQKMIDRGRAWLRDEIAMNGDIDLGDGKVLILRQTTRKEIDAKLAMPILKERFGPAEGILEDAIEIGTGKLERALGAIAPKKGKGKLIAEVYSALREAGAMYDVPFQNKLEVVDATERASETEGNRDREQPLVLAGPDA